MLVALFACAAFQLAGAVHTATVRHVRCADHGALVELGLGSDGAHDPHPEACMRPGADADAHHAHCDLSSTPPSRIAHAQPHAQAHALTIALDTDAPTSEHAPIGVLALAPKGSPPV